ncbi:ABC transporter permease, partial [Streptococcus pyogenes]
FPEFGLLALAVLPTMISGGIDLSVVAVANLAAIVAAVIMRAGPEYAWLAIPAALTVGICCGALNGFLIAYLRLPPILATLGTMQLFAGIGIVITRVPAITGLPDWYTSFGNQSLGGVVPLPLLIFVVV